jgi:hypothetical protein
MQQKVTNCKREYWFTGLLVYWYISLLVYIVYGCDGLVTGIEEL